MQEAAALKKRFAPLVWIHRYSMTATTAHRHDRPAAEADGHSYPVSMTESRAERHPVDLAKSVVSQRLSDGWAVLGIEGLWREGRDVLPDLAYIFDGSPDGVSDGLVIDRLLGQWPTADSFEVEILFMR
jgi:hypothetical protein